MAIDLAAPPAVTLHDFTGLDAVFGASGKHYLTREQLGDWYDMNQHTPFHKAAAQIFYKGGKLADFGLTIKPGLDKGKVMTNVRALLCSFEPKHEIKMGTVAAALANWCDLSASKKSQAA